MAVAVRGPPKADQRETHADDLLQPRGRALAEECCMAVTIAVLGAVLA